MKTYVKKVSHTILIGLIILLIITVIYLVIPKYQIQSGYKINTITGQVSEIYKSSKSSVFNKYKNYPFLNKYKN